ncbi:MAG: hypothetical protein QMB80_07465 [Acinetobacter towneri]
MNSSESKIAFFLLIHDYSPIALSPQARWLLLKLIAELKLGEAVPSIKKMATTFHINEKKLRNVLLSWKPTEF